LAELEALDPSNRALQQNIWALEDQAAAAEEAARATAELAAEQERIAAEQERIAAEGFGLETEYLTLIGDTEALRARELEALDESNRALQQQIWAEEDRVAAIDESTRAIQDAIAALDPQNYATRFQYERDLALASNGVGVPGGTSFIPSAGAAVPASTAAATGDPVVAELAIIRTKITALEARTFKWDREGLPEERAA
jgi:hypothetical protein